MYLGMCTQYLNNLLYMVQFPTMVQLVANRDKQPVTTPIPTTMQVTTNLPTHIPRGS
jgi:hypothetical protein